MAIVSHQPLSTLGGVPVHILQLAEAMFKLGVNVEVIAPSFEPVKRFPSYLFHVTPIQLNNRLQTIRALEYSFKVYRYLTENRMKFDIIHGSQWSMFFSCLKKKEVGLPMVTKFHGTFFYEVANTFRYEMKNMLRDDAGSFGVLPIYAYMESICAKKSDGIICISNSVRNEVLAIVGRKYEDKIQVIYNGVDTEKFRPLSKIDELRRIYDLNEDDKVILYVGLLQARKGIHHIINGVKSLLKRHSNLKVLIVGKGERLYSRYLLNLAKPKDNFIFLGKVSHNKLLELYNIADVYVIPSVYEPLGNVVLEAMACGKPVLARKAGGLQEIVKHGVTGFLLEGEGKYFEQQLMNYINILLDDDKLRNDMGNNARRYVEDNFSWKKTAALTVRFIKKILERA